MSESSWCNPDRLRERALENDPTLIKDVIGCFRGDLERFLRQRCGHSSDADDALQDVWESTLRYMDGYRGESSIKNWLYRLASSSCMKMRRGQKNNQNIHTSSTLELELTKIAFSAQKVEVESMLEAKLMPIREALEKLSPLDQKVLWFRDGEGFSTAEAAETLELSESAIKSRLHRARQQVRTELDSEE